ncbi:hypothetical protein PI95_022155 [Hassallia byssoidea VB512170]|uniref:Uncharacterized protein n=1 Tax=Hassallia byssoidea VB512170 TaxID=1304833 RepID=A0A846HE04_9CYAN|nr:hypothetical protein [Hassalia byssoidea]NEU75188.1 hypothetical protein [Hassalia byssoidea VB512170]
MKISKYASGAIACQKATSQAIGEHFHPWQALYLEYLPCRKNSIKTNYKFSN